ncbi:hypothetical protein Tco_0908301 [Tanacetum coccineum]|uniref:Uncharacterized protein n=1 Tax=Tanacetum coccineum TaxID=301880 RepID=A0ABQ5CLT6_9ASTR
MKILLMKMEIYGMGDSIRVSVSLGGGISSGGKKSQESNIGDSGNTRDGGKTGGGSIGACGGIGGSLAAALYAYIYGSSQSCVAKVHWRRLKLLMQGTSLTNTKNESVVVTMGFDKFIYKKRESLHEYYLRFTLLLNDMNIYKMPLEQFQVNTKFLNTLPDEWSKFVTDVKLVKDLHTTNVDQLHAYLEQLVN